MADLNKHTIIGGFDYESAFGFTRIFRSFKIATQPGKLAVALFMIVTMFVVGYVLDGIFAGNQVYIGEFQQFVTRQDTASFQQWRDRQKDQLTGEVAMFLRQRLHMDYDSANQITQSPKRWALARAQVNTYYDEQLAKLEKARTGMGDALYQNALRDTREARLATLRVLNEMAPRGVFKTIVEIKLDAFQSLINAVKTFDIGWNQLDPAVTANDHSVIGSMRLVIYEMPRWLWATHPWFLIFWGILFVGVWSLLGGAISRMAVVESATGERIGIGDAVGFSYRRWLAYALAPLIPLFIVGLFMLVLALVGLLFHAAVLNILGALALIVAIPMGFVMAFFLIGWVGAVHLMYPAISAEGTDAFDSLSRSYSYVITRPWRFLAYTVLMLAYGVITYLFVGLFVFLALYMVQSAMATWTSGVTQVFPKPVLGHLRYESIGEGLGGTAKIAAALIRVFVLLAVGVVAAYAVSYYFAAWSAIYLLLRGRADGTDPAEVYSEPAPAPGSSSPAALTPASSVATVPAVDTPTEAPDKAPDAVEADNE